MLTYIESLGFIFSYCRNILLPKVLSKYCGKLSLSSYEIQLLSFKFRYGIRAFHGSLYRQPSTRRPFTNGEV